MPLRRFVSLIVSLWAAGLCAAQAHPHVWVSVQTEVQLGPDQAITGFKHRWTFDEFYTAFAIQGLDKNNDGQYSQEELKELADVNMQSLKEFEFFTYPKVSDKLADRKEPENYWLEYKESLLTLHFTLPLEKPVLAQDKANFTFSVYDPTFYVAFSFAEKLPVTLAKADGGTPPCQPKLSDRAGRTSEIQLGQSLGEFFDPSADIGAQFAQTVSLNCQS